MCKNMYSQLRLREIFHLEFLRWFTRKVKPECYALKEGSNLRFFFNSFRYSEDMDIDIRNVEVSTLKEIVMNIPEKTSFQDVFRSFGIERLVLPDMSKAKQTETTQRFKIHLITSAGEDLYTKIEFSRRGFKGDAVTESVSSKVLRPYKTSSLIVSHYDADSAAAQKIGALAGRSSVQARDVFDLYVLSSQCEPSVIGRKPKTDKTILEIASASPRNDRKTLDKAYANIFEISFEQFRDTVVSYFSPEDRDLYGSSSAWDEIKLKVSEFIKR